MRRKKLSTWSAEQGVHYRTAFLWATAGTMPVPVERTPGGHYRVICDPLASDSAGRVVLYGLVSSSDQKSDLGRQMERLASFASGRGYTNVKRVEDQRLANVRKDALHKATTGIASRFRGVALEDLRVRNMTRKGHGKRGLNRVLADASLAEFRRQLTYKLQRAGGRLVLVDPAYTSRRCSVCGAFTDCGSCETFTCSACAAVLDRDANAARNILALSRGEVDAASWTESLNARGEAVRRPSFRALAHVSVKRESIAREQLCLFPTA